MIFLNRGWGPPIYRDNRWGGYYYPHHHDGPGSLIGGVIGGVLGSLMRPERQNVVVVPEPDGDENYQHALELIAKVPDGGVVVLTPMEYRALTDKSMVSYEGEQAFALKRKLTIADGGDASPT